MGPDLRAVLEPRVLRVERGLDTMDQQLQQLRIAAVAIQQGLWDDASDLRARGGAGGGGSPPPTANTTVSGTIRACGGLAAVGVTVDVDSGGGTFTTDGSGHYSGMIYLSANAAVPIVVTPASARFTTLSFTTGTLTAGSSNTVATHALPPATGYHCSPLCSLPLADNFDLADSSVPGNHPMTYGGFGGGGWTSVVYNAQTASLSATNGAFNYSTLSGVLISSNCTPPITFTFKSGTRTWTITNA